MDSKDKQIVIKSEKIQITDDHSTISGKFSKIIPKKSEDEKKKKKK